MVTRYVNTDATPGGNGVSNAVSGSNRAWASLSEANTALTSASINDNLQLLMCGSAVDAMSSRLNLSLTNWVLSGRTIYLKANRSAITGYHGGKWNVGTYRFSSTVSSNYGLDVSLGVNGGNFTIVLDGLQFEKSNAGECLSFQAYSGNWGTMKNCIVKCNAGATAGVLVYAYNGSAVLQSCVISGVGSGYGINHSRGGQFFNCLVCNFNRGINSDLYSPTIANCVIFNNADDIYGGGTINYCATDDGDGTNKVVVSNWANQFINPNYLSEVDYRVRRQCTLTKAGTGTAGYSIGTENMGSALREADRSTVGPYEYGSSSQSASFAGFSL